MRQFIFSFLIILLFSLYALRSLISVPFYTSHDGFTHTARIAAYYKTLQDKQFPPRWAQNFNNGLGSPIFTYIYPLPYAIGAGVHFLGVNFQNDFRLIMVVSTILSAIVMYFWLKDEFGQIPGLVGAIFYVWVPYRFLNLYVRAAFAENIAFTLLPLSFLAIKRGWKIRLILSLVFLLLSHNVIAAVFLPILFLWAIIQKRTRLIILSTIWAFLCAAFIYLPDIFERNFVRFDQGISYFRDHFVTWWQLIRSPWGYGFDFPGTLNDAMSFQLGISQIVVFSSVSFLLLKKRNLKAIFFWVLTVVVVFLMTDSPIIVKVWETIPVMKTVVDFPWRFLGVASFALAYLCAFLINSVRYKKILAIILIILVLVFNRNHIRVNESLNFSDATFIDFSGTGTATSNEFTPSFHTNQKFPEPKEKVSFISGTGEITQLSSKANILSFVIKASESAKIRVNRLYFPKTVVYVDNHETVYKISGGEDLSGLIELDISPPGGKYKVVFYETSLRQIANLVSCIAFVLLIFPLGYEVINYRSRLQRGKDN